MSSDVLYDDTTLTVDADGLTIKRYYFPLARPKRIAFDEITGVEVRPTGIMSKWRLWGSHNAVTWMPLDMGRARKDHLVEFDLGGRIKPAVTPDEPERVAALVRANI